VSGRQVGSGFGHSTAAGFEELFAARLTSDWARARAALAVLQTEYASGWCGIDPATIDLWLTQLGKDWGLSPTTWSPSLRVGSETWNWRYAGGWRRSR
jgi:hypothetical protein